MKTCFSEEKLIKQFGNPLREPLLSANPLFLNNFFMTLLFIQILKLRTPPPNFMGWGWGGGIYVLAVRWSVK